MKPTSASTAAMGTALYRLARMPPRTRCPLRLCSPAAAACSRNARLERGLREREGDVHPGARVLRDAIAVERGAVDRGVQRLGLGAVALAHGGETALLLQPFEDQPRQVPGERRRRIEQRPLVGNRADN